MGVADVQISDWYELVQGEDLEQGDILERCPVFRPPADFVRNFAASKGLRPRMQSPYREHLSQALARYFMRVGLPSEVPSFVTSDTKAEKEAVKALKKLDESALANVLSTFQPATSQTPKSAEAPSDRPGWYAWLCSVFGRRG